MLSPLAILTHPILFLVLLFAVSITSLKLTIKSVGIIEDWLGFIAHILTTEKYYSRRHNG